MTCQTGVVIFDYPTWIGEFPEFATITQTQAQGYFNRACNFLDNTACSIVQDVNKRATLLNLLTAHICALNAPLNGQPPNPLVGRISQATEGSVTVQTQNDYPPGSAQWFQQTKYGAEYWQATLQYRSARYVPGAPQFGPNGFGWSGFRGGGRTW
jgi:hypothetical protein